MMSINVNSGTTHIMSSLVAYVNYSVIVAATNVNGTGPFSSSVARKSGEDGELHLNLLCSYIISFRMLT